MDDLNYICPIEFEENYENDFYDWTELRLHQNNKATFDSYLTELKQKYVKALEESWVTIFTLEEINKETKSDTAHELTKDYLEAIRKGVSDLKEILNIIEKKIHRRNFEQKLVDSKDAKLKDEIESELKATSQRNDLKANSDRIQIKGSLQSIGYLFTQLIEKGYLEVPKRNGKTNISAISRMISKHFEFIDRQEQPKAEDIRKALFTDNQLSYDKQQLFKIPFSKTINKD